MAPKHSQVCFPKTWLMLGTALFIIMCVPSAVCKLHWCYWCGPLAEQVHRSRRAPPCGQTVAGAGDVAACEPGVNHCAIVASSPPYVESRYCVKLYQDECYPLFCNSTRTWKMICPCRGHLCNGHNTEREKEAFAILSKLVANTHNSRIKRSAENSSFYNTEDKEPTFTTEVIEDTSRQNIINNSLLPDSENKNIQSIMPESKIFENELSSNSVNAITSTSIEELSPTPENNMNINSIDEGRNTDSTHVSQNVNNIYEITHTDNLYNIISATIPTSHFEVKSIIVVESSSTSPITKLDAKVTEITKLEEETSMVTPPLDKNKMNDGKELLTAEALQQDASPTQKTTEIYHEDEIVSKATEPSTVDITVNTQSFTISSITKPPKPAKNYAAQKFAHTFTIGGMLLCRFIC